MGIIHTVNGRKPATRPHTSQHCLLMTVASKMSISVRKIGAMASINQSHILPHSASPCTVECLARGDINVCIHKPRHSRIVGCLASSVHAECHHHPLSQSTHTSMNGQGPPCNPEPTNTEPTRQIRQERPVSALSLTSALMHAA